ncbi:SAM-dependent methyltransferase [Kitasatospora sp. NPDC058032]|uniref:SAM-dependent methyltransferase n=1 Tax=Kitasatospora sp. NPDC058032 TaxID=3346307 RepID=UPI0036D78B0A
MTGTSTAWIDDPFADAVRTGRGPLWLRDADGRRIPLDIERWCAPAAGGDHSLLMRCFHLSAPVVDLGCGPGRLVAALLAVGVPALGVDVTPAAVTRTLRIGGAALCRSVFDRLPAEGRWGAALPADGNLGIGGNPEALLRRAAELIAPDGLLLTEVEPREVDERVTVRVEGLDGRLGPPFAWARPGPLFRITPGGRRRSTHAPSLRPGGTPTPTCRPSPMLRMDSLLRAADARTPTTPACPT